MKRFLAFFLIVQLFLVQIASNFPQFIESYYSNGIYLKIANVNRILFGTVPFSIGDLLYISLIICLIGWFINNRKRFLKNWKVNLLTVCCWASIVYFLFHILWGLNYYRIPLDKKLKINKDYTVEELLLLTEKMIARANAVHLQITHCDTLAVEVPYSNHKVFAKAAIGFERLPKALHQFEYKNSSVKTSLLRVPLSYMGFGGYLNPFTNEAQLNTLKPNFTLPMTTCHEMVHQLGIASESECNFIGFMAAINHNDLYFQYSAYSFITRFCLSNLERIEKNLGKNHFKKLNLGIQKNIIEHEQFWDSYHSPIDVFFEFFYDKFLKANKQPDGMMSYSKFVGLVIGYEKAIEKNN